LGGVTSAASALEWLRSTYLWQRCAKNPAAYGIARGITGERLAEEL
jgi:hypothetical protein